MGPYPDVPAVSAERALDVLFTEISGIPPHTRCYGCGPVGVIRKSSEWSFCTGFVAAGGVYCCMLHGCDQQCGSDPVHGPERNSGCRVNHIINAFLSPQATIARQNILV